MPFNPLTVYVLLLISTLTIELDMASARVRPSDLLHPTDERNLGRGYAQPGARYQFTGLSGLGGVADPYEQQFFLGLRGEIGAPIGQHELKVEWALYSYSLSTEEFSENALFVSHLDLAYRWKFEPFSDQLLMDVGMGVPMSQRADNEDPDTLTHRAAYHAFAASMGGLNRWQWEANYGGVYLKSYWEHKKTRSFYSTEVAGAYLVQMIGQANAIGPLPYAQVRLGGGYHFDQWCISSRVGYGMTMIATELADADRASIDVKMQAKGEIKYWLQLILNLDPPLGVIGGDNLVMLNLGIDGYL